MFAGQNLKFPTIDQQYKILRDVNIYIDVEREYKQEMNYTDFLISLGSKYNLPSTEIHAVYNDCKFMIQGEEAMRRK
jgi:beta-galactosidase beta subunit